MSRLINWKSHILTKSRQLVKQVSIGCNSLTFVNLKRLYNSDRGYAQQLSTSFSVQNNRCQYQSVPDIFLHNLEKQRLTHHLFKRKRKTQSDDSANNKQLYFTLSGLGLIVTAACQSSNSNSLKGTFLSFKFIIQLFFFIH